MNFKHFFALCLVCFAPFLVAAATAATVVLAWNANSDSDVAGYRIYYGTASAPYKHLDVATPTATIPDLENGVTYTFVGTAYNPAGAESEYSAPLLYTVGSSRVIPPAILANISSRASVQTGENVMIGGFIIDGIVGKKVALRAIGPSLTAAGVIGALADPFLQLVDSTGTVLASNDSWNVPGQEIESYGLAPTDPREAALVATLVPGSYSAIVSGKGASGVGLFELYDLDADKGRVANISTRSRVETGDNVMIGGFILTGRTPNQVIVRAIGPSLLAHGVRDALLDPTLELYDGNGNLIGFNDDWRTTQESEIIATKVAPTDEREAAIVATLQPGAYSSVVHGANNTTGVALVEVYALN